VTVANCPLREIIAVGQAMQDAAAKGDAGAIITLSDKMVKLSAEKVKLDEELMVNRSKQDVILAAASDTGAGESSFEFYRCFEVYDQMRSRLNVSVSEYSPSSHFALS